eukprot:NODE_141_length_2638_cov_38.888760_g114_i0.p1 GENE.NODE_141_length_2638_cov_38.888760_g114_i0~~NODE_141_length_2638_cov_38.888760_g114_i0.p1  ORF type:complete len:849 (+),score=331.44 NODE_141_length_2638_cov_38.888760_g114_i0:207-2549(+)
MKQKLLKGYAKKYGEDPSDSLREEVLKCLDPSHLDALVPHWDSIQGGPTKKAERARELGLGPMIDRCIEQRVWPNDFQKCAKELNLNLKTVIEGVQDGLVEALAQDVRFVDCREMVHHMYQQYGLLTASPKEARILAKAKAIEEGRDAVEPEFIEGIPKSTKFARNHFDFYNGFMRELKLCQPHQIMAVARGVREGFLTSKLLLQPDDTDRLLTRMQKAVGDAAKGYRLGADADVQKLLWEGAIRRALQDRIVKIVMTRLWNDRLDFAFDASVEVFRKNLKALLYAAPFRPPVVDESKPPRILGIDPGFKNGCKVAVVDCTSGRVITADKFFLTQPKEAIDLCQLLVEEHGCVALAIGNGQGSRECETMLDQYKFPTPYHIVREQGASIYSVSKIARDELPDLDPTLRGAVFIGRRLLDPLNELCKLEPQHIGVGQYQLDVKQKALEEAVKATITTCVSFVGVNINTASATLLRYVSGLNSSLADKIVAERMWRGIFVSRDDMRKRCQLPDQVYEQAAGFLRVDQSVAKSHKDGNLMDCTAVHPEQEEVVHQLLKVLGLSLENCAKIVQQTIDEKGLTIPQLADMIGVGEQTLHDIVLGLDRPGVDIRSEISAAPFHPKVRKIKDLEIGQTLPARLDNITDFGVFFDIGVEQDAMMHKMSHKSFPWDKLVVGQKMDVQILAIGAPDSAGKVRIQVGPPGSYEMEDGSWKVSPWKLAKEKVTAKQRAQAAQNLAKARATTGNLEARARSAQEAERARRIKLAEEVEAAKAEVDDGAAEASS